MSGLGGSLGESRGRITLDTGQADSAAEGLERRLQNMENAGGGIDALSSRFRTLGTILTGVGAAITGALATPIAMGTKAAWGQVDAVEQATVALRAYGGSTEQVEQQIANMVAYARSDLGVLFQRQDLFAAAQGLSVMGAETDRLSDYVEIMSRSVGVGASTWNELSQIIGRVGSTGQLTGYEFNALTKAGFQLDESLKGATVTWDELFEALDAGIPADAMAGQATTIRGMMIRLQSAIRGVGLAFLGVDADSSQFIEGGLGDTLKNGLDQARRAFVHLQGPAENFGKIVAALARVVSGFIEVIISLPTSLTSVIITLTGFAGVLSLVGGSAMLLLPKIASLGKGLNGLMGLGANAKAFDGFRLGLTMIRTNLGMLLPALAAVGVAILAFTAYQENFLGLKTIVDTLAKAFMDFGGVAVTGILMATRGMSGLRTVATALVAPFTVLMRVFPPLGAAVRLVAPWFTQLANVFRLAASHIPFVGTALARIAPIFSRFLGPIGLAITAIDLFRKNFLGIRDMVNDVIGVFSGLTGAFRDAFKGGGDEAAIAADKVAQYAEATHVVDGVTVYTAFRSNADGEIEKAGEIIESYANADGTTAQVLISGDDGEYWATIDLATGEISNAEITVEAKDDRGTIQKVIDGLDAVQAKANELGLGGFTGPFIAAFQRVLSVIQTVVPYIQYVIDRFRALRDAGLNPVSAALGTFSDLLGLFDFGPLQSGIDMIRSGLDQMSRGFTRVLDALQMFGAAAGMIFQGKFAQGFNLAQAAAEKFGKGIQGVFSGLMNVIGGLANVFDRLAAMFPALSGSLGSVANSFRAFGSVIGGLGDLIAAVFAGDWSAALSSLGSMASGAIDLFTSMYETIGTLLSELGSIIQNALGKAVDALSKKFPAFGNTIKRVGSVVSNAVGVFQKLGQALASLMRGDFRGVWDNLTSALGDTIKAIGSLMLTVPTLIWDAFRAIDWAGLWRGLVDGATAAWNAVKSFFTDTDWGAIWDGLVDSALETWATVRETVSNAWSEVTAFFDSIDWTAIWDGLTDAASSTWNAIVETVQNAWREATSFVSDFDWGSLWDNVGDIAGELISRLGDLAGAVMEWIRSAAPSGEQIMSAITTAANFAWDVLSWFGDIASSVISWLAGAAPSGEQIVSAIATAANFAWDVISWFGSLAGKVISWLGDAAPSGEDIVSAIATAANFAWDILKWFGGIAENVISWLADAAPDGEAIISAIATAANFAWDVLGWFGGIASNVIDWLADAAPGGEAIVSAIATAVDFAWDILKWFGSIASNVIEWLTDAAPDVGDIVDALFGALEWTADALSGLASGLIDAAKGAISAAWEGLKGWAGELWDRLAGWLFGGSTEVDAGSVAEPLEDAVSNTTVDMSGLASSIAEALGNALAQLQDTSKIQAGLTGLMTKAAEDAATTGGLDFATVATLFMNQFIDAMLKAIGDDESGIGSNMAGAVENMFWQAASEMDGRLDDDAEVIATAFNDALVAKIDEMDGTSLSGPIPDWIGKAVEKASSDLDTVAETLATGVNDAVVSSVSELDEGGLGEALGGWFGRSITTFTEVATDLSESIATLIGTTITTGMNELDESGLGTALGSWFGRSITTFTEVVTSLSESVATLIETSIVGGVDALGGDSLGGALGTWFTDGVTAAQSQIDTATTTMMTSFNMKVTTELTNTKTAWNTHQADVMGVLVTLSGSVGTEVDTMTNRMKTTWTTRLAETLAEVNRQYGAIRTSISTKMGEILTRVSTDLGTMRTRFSEGMREIRSTVETGMRDLVSVVRDGMRDFVSAVRNGMSDAENEARNGVGRIIRAVSGFGSQMSNQGENLGRQMGNGIARGIESAIGRVTSAANRIVAEANRAARAAAEVKSPSRLFAIIGRYLTEGLAKGMTENFALNKVIGGAEKLIATASNTVSKGSLGELRALQLQDQYERYLMNRQAISGSVSEPSGLGSVTVVNVYTLPTDEWTRAQGQLGESANFVNTWSQQDVMSKFLPRR